MITLFAEPPRSEKFSVTFAVSIVLHASLLSLLTMKVMQTHRVIEKTSLDRYSLRVLQFHSTEPYVRQSSEGSVEYHGPKAPSSTEAQTISQASAHPIAAGGSSPGSPPIMRQAPRLMPAPQTLVQPDVTKPLQIPDKTPVPLVVLWSADKANAPKIVPPLPEKPTIAVVHPSLDTPIKEEKLADVKISSNIFVTQTPVLPPSTTSPIVVHGPEEVNKVAETTSRQPEKPTPARVIALSDVRAPEGKVAVPLTNQSSAKAPPGSLVPGVLKEPVKSGNGESASKSSANGTGKGAGDKPSSKGESASGSAPGQGTGAEKAVKSSKPGTNQTVRNSSSKGATASGPAESKVAGSPSAPSNDKGAALGQAAQSGASIGLAQGPVSGSSSANQTGSVHISLPKDGQFGVVVLGSSIEDKYPETAELWSGRLASTVYLHVGLNKSWILQYALPRLTDASTGGGRIEAPWPYEIVRPNLSADDLDSDALILHGLVNKDGRFEKLEVVFPPQFVQTQMVVGVFNQWQFRPAKLNGQFAPVEVLLIIPGQAE